MKPFVVRQRANRGIEAPIKEGQPDQNAFIERFNETYRDEVSQPAAGLLVFSLREPNLNANEIHRSKLLDGIAYSDPCRAWQ